MQDVNWKLIGKLSKSIKSIGGVALVLAPGALFFSSKTAFAQEMSCKLGHVRERVPASYPDATGGSNVAGTVELMATFAPDGRVASTKVLSGPRGLRFDAQAYVNGWKADPSDGQRQCLIELDYRFDSSQGVCGRNRRPSVKSERLDDTHVVMHLSCDIW